VIFSRWVLIWGTLAALLYGFATNLLLTIIGLLEPSEFMLMLPYVILWIAMSGSDILTSVVASWRGRRLARWKTGIGTLR
jgi:ABC-type uncharacterized transport system permease subunit